MKIVSYSERDTYLAGKQLGKKLSGGDTVLLSGELGAGKTVFTKGIAVSLGVKESVLSPTFTIMNEYAGKSLRLCHFDAYRLSSGEEAIEVGVADDIGSGDTVCVIEWHENIASVLPKKNVIRVCIRYTSENEREIEICDDE